jgi:fructose-specific phosphotransferase system IIC component
MRRISLLALLVGGTVSYMVPSIVAALVGIVARILITSGSHLSQTASMRQLIWNPFYYYGILAVQIVCSVIGGYLAGVTAKHDEALNGLLSSLIVVLISLGFHALDPHPLPIRLLRLGGYVTASALGGYLRALQVGRKAQRTVPTHVPLT